MVSCLKEGRVLKTDVMQDANVLLSTVRNSAPWQQRQAEYLAQRRPTQRKEWQQVREAKTFTTESGIKFATLSLMVPEKMCDPDYLGIEFFVFRKNGASWQIVSYSSEADVVSRYPRDFDGYRFELALQLGSEPIFAFVGGADIYLNLNGYRPAYNFSGGYYGCPC